MGNHKKNLFWPKKSTNPNCTLCQNYDKDTWPHLLSTCNHKFLIGLRIARHNVATQQLVQLLKSCTHMRHYTLTNASKQRRPPTRQHHPIINLTLFMPHNKVHVPSIILPKTLYMYKVPCKNKHAVHTFPQPYNPNNRIHIHT